MQRGSPPGMDQWQVYIHLFQAPLQHVHTMLILQSCQPPLVRLNYRLSYKRKIPKQFTQPVDMVPCKYRQKSLRVNRYCNRSFRVHVSELIDNFTRMNVGNSYKSIYNQSNSPEVS